MPHLDVATAFWAICWGTFWWSGVSWRSLGVTTNILCYVILIMTNTEFMNIFYICESYNHWWESNGNFKPHPVYSNTSFEWPSFSEIKFPCTAYISELLFNVMGSLLVISTIFRTNSFMELELLVRRVKVKDM